MTGWIILAAVSAAREGSVPTVASSSPPWDAVWGLIGAVVGAAIGFITAFVATTRTIDSQERLQRKRFDRDESAARAILDALLLDVYQYVTAAAHHAQFDPGKWARPVKRLVDFTSSLEIGRALEPEQVRAVLTAGFEADLTLNRLTAVARDHAFLDGFEERHPNVDLDTAEMNFIGQVMGIAREALEGFNRALTLRGLERNISQGPTPSVLEVQNALRLRAGRPPITS